MFQTINLFLNYKLENNSMKNIIFIVLSLLAVSSIHCDLTFAEDFPISENETLTFTYTFIKEDKHNETVLALELYLKELILLNQIKLLPSNIEVPINVTLNKNRRYLNVFYQKRSETVIKVQVQFSHYANGMFFRIKKYTMENNQMTLLTKTIKVYKVEGSVFKSKGVLHELSKLLESFDNLALSTMLLLVFIFEIVLVIFWCIISCLHRKISNVLNGNRLQIDLCNFYFYIIIIISIISIIINYYYYYLIKY